MVYKNEASRKAAEWYKKNKEKKQAYDAKRRAENPELYRAASKRWREAHPGKKNADTANRRAAKLQRTPVWGQEGIKDLYVACKMINNAYGTEFEVDHIVPLQSTDASGLHVRNNLQLLPAHINQSKNNRLQGRK
jgi:5-methylcytosine-specific restriction endonuclease McrA